MTATTTPSRFIGCDVGKTSVEIFDHGDGCRQSVANEPAALAAFAATLDAASFVVCEATGGYEAALLAALVGAGVPVHRADARKVKASSAPSASWARPTRSMRARSPAMARSAMASCRAGARRTKRATSFSP